MLYVILHSVHVDISDMNLSNSYFIIILNLIITDNK